MKPKLLFDLRADNRYLLEQLKEEFDVYPYGPVKPKLQTFPPPFSPPPGVDPDKAISMVEENWDSAAGAVSCILSLEPRPDVALFWNAVLPGSAAAALACRERGIPTYEIEHSRLSTPRFEHFETHSAADFIVGSAHNIRFRADNDCPATGLAFGQGPYDDPAWLPGGPVSDVPGLKRMVLKTSVDTNPYSAWYLDSSFYQENENAIWGTLLYLYEKEPFTLVVSSRRKVGDPSIKALGASLIEAGFAEGDVVVTDDEPIQNLINASDLVVCQRSGVQVDSAILGKNCLGVEIARPMCVDPAETDRGVYTAQTKDELQDAADLLFFDKDVRAEQRAQQQTNHSYWGGDGRTAERLIAHIKEQL